MIDYTPIPTITIGALHVSTHGLLIAGGFLVAALWGRRRAAGAGLDVERVDTALVIGAIAGLVGARVVYLIFAGGGMSVTEMLKIWEGGLSSHGGYLFGIIVGLGYLKWKRVEVLRYADALIPYMLVGWAIGRIGCFLNWDSFGRVPTGGCPHCVIVDGVPRHPTQLYESVGYLAAFLLVKKAASWPVHVLAAPGARAALALGLFGVVRTVVDSWRAESVEYLLFSRVVSVALIVGAAAYLILRARRAAVVR